MSLFQAHHARIVLVNRYPVRLLTVRLAKKIKKNPIKSKQNSIRNNRGLS